MTLTTRLTAFFLAGLAVVLAGFSVALYVLVGRPPAPAARRPAGRLR